MCFTENTHVCFQTIFDKKRNNINIGSGQWYMYGQCSTRHKNGFIDNNYYLCLYQTAWSIKQDYSMTCQTSQIVPTVYCNYLPVTEDQTVAAAKVRHP